MVENYTYNDDEYGRDELRKIEKLLQKIGVEAKDNNGQYRTISEVLKDIGAIIFSKNN